MQIATFGDGSSLDLQIFEYYRIIVNQVIR